MNCTGINHSNHATNSNPHSNQRTNGQHNGQAHQIINLLFDKCNFILVNATDKLKQLNSILTLYVILLVNNLKSKKLKPNCIQLSAGQLQSLNENLLNLIDSYSNDDKKDVEHNELVKLILKLYLCVLCKDDELNENDLVELLMNDQLFDKLFRILCSPKRQNLHQLALMIITLVQNYQNANKSNLFTIRLSILENEIALNSYAQIISKQINDFNQEYRKEYFDPKINQNGGAMESIFAALTGLVLSNQNEPSGKFEQTLLQTDSRSILLALYDMIQLNRNFIPFLLTNHSLNGEDKEANNLLINFLEFCSIVIFCLKEYAQKGEHLQKKLNITTKLCFIILTCIVEEQFASSIMHDSNNVFNKVQIHRSKMRHRTIDASNPIKANRPIAYSILDLMIEFQVSNLRKKHFPIDLYVFCNNIILKLLCYQIKFECRKEFNWQELWHSLFSLLKYLNANYDKSDELLVKRRSRMLLLANNVVNLFNLFIIFGDTILHSPIDYDNLYYELLRNHDLFDNLAQLGKHHSLSKRKDEKEGANKLIDSLENIESIIGHFISKINESKTEPPLSEQEIREIVRNNYDTLSIKVKDGLDIYENYEGEKMFFKKKLLKKIVEQIKVAHLTNLDELVNEQQIVLQSILNC